MIHLGDITKIKGYEAPTVDCVIGGSPCQDLSLAGKRAGLAGSRSGLYMEQIRIIKEMREYDRSNGRTGVDIRPRYMVWENVPGAFSTNKGQDFAAVLEEAIRVAEPEAPNVSVPEKGWPTAGCLVGESWSVAWRVLDAQFWGTSDKPLPQRRRRIALVADFGGLSAPEILFVRKSVSGDIEPGKPKGKETPRDAGESSGGASFCIQGSMIGRADHNGPQGDGSNEDVCFTLNTTDRHAVAYSIENHPADSRVDIDDSGMVQTLTSRMGTGGGNVPMVMEPILLESNQNHATVQTNGISTTLTASMGMGGGYVPMVTQPVGEYWDGTQVCGTLTANNAGGNQRMPDKENFNCVVQKVDEPIAIDRAFFNQGKNALYEPQVYDDGTVSTLVSKGPSAVAVRHIVRRLTPLECERLQGFPDGWTDIGEWVDSKGKRHKEADSPRYKALGNSIALPPWKWVLKRLCACYERDATMASLFDGIGGFPYIWEQLNGKGSCLWASEIEEFPIAVTKVRFGE